MANRAKITITKKKSEVIHQNGIILNPKHFLAGRAEQQQVVNNEKQLKKKQRGMVILLATVR